ncbi:MAG: metal-sensitive transcriptional regulator [Nitrospirota bacterium]|nr:MAG: metal-sensitive transcriptional regulator [Nitrospirota bacterium]
MKPKTRTEALKRLAYIDGHLNGVRKMIEEDRYCIDVLKQMHAIRKSIEKLETMLLEDHLHTCVVDGIKGGREEQIVAELRALYTVGR